MTTCSDEAIANGLDPSTPIDREQLKKDARFLMGAIEESILPDSVLDGIVESCIHNFEDSIIYRCDVLYCTILATLKYLIRQAWAHDGGSSSKDLVSRKEKVGNVSVEESYSSSSTSNNESGWEKMYEYFLRHPEDVCECLAKTKSGLGLIKIGGTNQEEYDEIANNPNVKTMWDTGSSVDNYNSRRVEKRKKRRNNSKRFSL